MRIFILGVALAALAVPAVSEAQPGPGYRDQGYDRRGDRGDRNNRADRYDRDRQTDWRQGRNYDWNRPDPRYRGYDAARYYRAGPGYRERRLGRNDRVYYGNDGRYYCRRTDGTTGLILGGVLGGLVGNSLDRGRSSTLGTLLGAGGGALLGQSVDRGQVRCR